MSERVPPPTDEEEDPILERIRRERLPGEMESGMMTGSDEGEPSATDRFAGELSREEALRLLRPEGAGETGPAETEEEPRPGWPAD